MFYDFLDLCDGIMGMLSSCGGVPVSAGGALHSVSAIEVPNKRSSDCSSFSVVMLLSALYKGAIEPVLAGSV